MCLFVCRLSSGSRSVCGFHLEIQRQHVSCADRPDHHSSGYCSLPLPLRLPPFIGLLPPGSCGSAGHLYLQRQPAQRSALQPAAGKIAGQQEGGARKVQRGKKLTTTSTSLHHSCTLGHCTQLFPHSITHLSLSIFPHTQIHQVPIGTPHFCME